MVHVENNNVCNAHWDNLQGIYDGNNKKQRCLGEKSTLNLHKIKYLGHAKLKHSLNMIVYKS